MSRAAKFREQKQETVELTLPSGCTALVRRPPLLAWAMAGTIPPFFSVEVQKAWASVRESGQVDDPDQLDADQSEETLVLVRGLAEWAFVDPKLTEGAMDEEAIDPSYLSEEDWKFLAEWLMSGSPGVPVNTAAGGMPVEAVRSFRDEAQGAVAIHPEQDRGEVREATE